MKLIVAPLCPTRRRIFESYSNNDPSPGHSNLVSDKIYICSSLLLMISWLLPYLAKASTPDFNYGPENDSNSDCILALQRLNEFDLNGGHSPRYSNLVSDGVYICSGLLLMVSWWVPYPPKGCRPDFNNGPGGDSNSGRVFPPPWRLFESDSINSPLRATPILCEMKYTSVQVSYL